METSKEAELQQSTLTPAKVGHWTNARLAAAISTHNKWRRGEGEEMPFGPADLGLILDECARRLEEAGDRRKEGSDGD